MNHESAKGGDDLRAAADRLSREAREPGEQLDRAASHLDEITPELKQTMEDISGAVSGLADKAKGMLGALSSKIEAAQSATESSARDRTSVSGAPGNAQDDAMSRLARGADAGREAAREAAERGSQWLEKATGMSADDLIDRARTYGEEVTDSVKGAVESVQRSGEQAPREPKETLN